jgi:DNA-binding GntR family transcriptional regulator
MDQEQNLVKLERPQLLEEQAYHHIKRAILVGTFPPGAFLAEIQVAQDLGISKTPVRKAMARLQEEDFLDNVPYKGYFVADISAEDTQEIYQLRQMLECYLVRETALQFTTAELDEMEKNIAAATAAFERNDFHEYITLNRDFHHTFPRKFGNRRILKVLTNLDEHIRRILLHKLQNETHEILSPVQHEMIIDAIRAGDVEGAVTLMRNHLKGFHNQLESLEETGKL